MTNKKLISDTFKLVVDYLASEKDAYAYLDLDFNYIVENITNWYNHTEITDKYMLAAVAMESSYNPDFTWKTFESLRDFYFPHLISIEEEYYNNNFSEEEIRNAYIDAYIFSEGGSKK
jgi:hypothetical protein